MYALTLYIQFTEYDYISVLFFRMSIDWLIFRHNCLYTTYTKDFKNIHIETKLNN